MAGEGVGEIKEDKKGAALVKRPLLFVCAPGGARF